MFMDELLTGIIFSLFLSFLYGVSVGAQMPGLNGWRLNLRESILYDLYWAAGYSIFFLGHGLLLGLVGGLLALKGVTPEKIRGFYFIICFLGYFYFVAKWTLPKNELLYLLFACAATAGLFIIFLIIPPPFLLVVALCISFAFLIISAIYTSLRQKGRVAPGTFEQKEPEGPAQYSRDALPTKARVVVFGIDGLDWRIMDPLIREGRLPTLSRLKKDGVWGRLPTLKPISSPNIWTSIATGVAPEKHGICWWQKIILPGIRPLPGEPTETACPKDSGALRIIRVLHKRGLIKSIPMRTDDRAVKAVWGISSEFGKRTASVGWLFSWPAEKVNGCVISWFAFPFNEISLDFLRRKTSILPHRTYPEDLMDQVEPMIVTQGDLTDEERKNLYLTTARIDPKRKFADKIDLWYLAKDKTFCDISKAILDKERWDLFTVYLEGADISCHAYWTFLSQATNIEKHQAEILSISDSTQFKKDAEHFSKAIPAYYDYLDNQINRLMKAAGEDATFIILSDHGFNLDGTGHFSGEPDGAIIISGPITRKGALELKSISVYDITPTILYVLGIPVAEDMDGRVLEEAFSPDFLREFPVRTIKTFGPPEDII